MKTITLRSILIVAVGAIGLAAYGAYLSVPKHVSVVGKAQPIAHRSTARHAVSSSGIRLDRDESAALHRSADTRAISSPISAQDRAERATPASYKDAIRQNLFNAPQPPEPAKVVATPVKPVALPVVLPPPPPDPLADAVYAGSVTVDGKTSALIESRSTKQGEYVTAGGRWSGFEVVSITPGMLTLSVNGAQRALAVSDAINVIPLTASAGGAGSTDAAMSVSAGQQGVPAGSPQQDPAMLMRMKYMNALQSYGKNMDPQVLDAIRAKRREAERAQSQEALTLQKSQ